MSCFPNWSSDVLWQLPRGASWPNSEDSAKSEAQYTLVRQKGKAGKIMADRWLTVPECKMSVVADVEGEPRRRLPDFLFTVKANIDSGQVAIHDIRYGEQARSQWDTVYPTTQTHP